MSLSDPQQGNRFFLADSQGPRDEQQDAGICLQDAGQGTALLVVGDGVGGKSGGRIASQKVKAMAAQLWEERKGHLANPAEDLAEFCRLAHDGINEEGAKLGISPRTTIVALYLTASNAYWVHSGDSRLYHFRAGELVERTEDHTFLELMVQRGAVKEEDMGSHPDQNTLLQSLGGDEFITPSSGTAEIGADDAFLLCTDGFWERTKPEEMLELVFANRLQAAGLLKQAVDRAVERNGPKGDNVTVAIALPAKGKKPAGGVSQRNVRLLVGAALLLLLAAVLLFWPTRKPDVATDSVSKASPSSSSPLPSAKSAGP
jgi:serine/threonine protein phosphatase PrpC